MGPVYTAQFLCFIFFRLFVFINKSLIAVFVFMSLTLVAKIEEDILVFLPKNWKFQFWVL